MTVVSGSGIAGSVTERLRAGLLVRWKVAGLIVTLTMLLYVHRVHRVYRSMDLIPGSSIVLELCESRGGRPGLSVLTSLLVSVDFRKIYCTVLRHWSQLVPNMSTDI